MAIGGHRRPSEAIVRLRGAAPTKNESTPAAAQANGVGCDHTLPHVSVVSVLSPRASNWRVLMAASSLIT